MERSPPGVQLTRAWLRSPSHGTQHHPGGHTAQRVVVRVGVVEQGQTESYYSPEHGEQKSHGDDSVEAQPWGAAGFGGLAKCHDVTHGGTTPGRRPSMLHLCMRQHVQVHWIGRPAADDGHAPAAACSARAKLTVSVVW